ncbi:CaiB/BaiF CoA-transferase family protein [Alisedimentitalea sp. MJ-SS2]|uniref:CaiB/BaiF CoA transferase family protein n=1 Tax=Aliisedimentitalea sp. MJ-SS2 TaxID=3049795 RepID=UPI002910B9FA|nr:CaiB/BaiF CoA-transferase family protein [Alisedimentitalea sp. MJ-SS2]MDU8927239.1 CaiB/BaiF CoA-transferase family protein [Alisedimentitalea sp. MJ-SS2]
MPGPLDGIRILDMSRILAGPFATQLLGDMGAEVIKVERPGRGDDTRAWGPPFVPGEDGGELPESAYYLSANRNKRSVAVDMSSAKGAEVIRQMAGECDVVIENFKPGGLEKYGLDHDSLRGLYPGLVHCSISGFGHTGPNAHRPGYDLLAQAMSGIMAITGEPEGEPMKVGVGVADVMCGMYAANAIQAALIHRMKTGEGQHIDIALADTTTSWLVNAGTNYLLGGVEERLGNQHPNIVPYQVFKVADGHVIVAAGNDGQFERFCGIIGREDMVRDVRYATNPARLEHREALIAELAEELKLWLKAALIARMEAENVPGGPINTLKEVFDSEQVKAREMRIAMEFPGARGGKVDLIGNPVKFSGTPVEYRRPPPQCGAHTDEVLQELLGQARIEED